MKVKNSNKPLVTVAIPTYNRADLSLPTAIRCALNQTYDNIEIIVADNASTDQTPELMKSFNDDRIIYYRHDTNLGKINNMNFCLEKARGEYFLMYHDDDLIDADLVETCMRGINYKTGVGIIIAGARVIDDHDTVLRELPNPAAGLSTEDFMIAWYERKFHLFLCAILFNTKFFKQEGGFDSRYNTYIDVASEFTMAAKYGRADIPDVKASFREHTQSDGKTIPIADWCDDSVLLLDLACSFANDKKDILRRTGLATSIERNYRFSIQPGRRMKSIKNMIVVWRKFNYRFFPNRHHLVQFVPFLDYVFRAKRFLFKR